MSLRRLLSAAGTGAFALALLSLAACDFAGGDDLSGRWTGTAVFKVDTVLAEQNARFIADYETVFTFNITDDEGLITGTVEGKTTGRRIVREAGFLPDTLYYNSSTPLFHEVFGTYLDPVLEVDVPEGPYESDLWTFDVSGRRAELNRFLIHNHEVAYQATEGSFTFALQSEEMFEMRRVSSTPDEEEPTEE